MKSTAEITKHIKQKALDIGFQDVGISKAARLKGFDFSLQQWLDKGYNGAMDYMNRNKEKRVDPTILVEGAKSVISLLASYYPKKHQPDGLPKVSKYSYGTDYHFVLKDKMKLLWDFIIEFYPDLQGRMFVDSAPVSDKLWAVNAGLGWIGKNSCLINQKHGSFVFISELIVNIELKYDTPYRSNFCGSCTKCIDACPTGAIVQPTVIDSSKCISYLTIENKNPTIPDQFKGKIKKRLFGCDICQDVCPWNKNPAELKFEEFSPNDFILNGSYTDWDSLDKAEFDRIFKKSPLKRSKHIGIKRNLDFISDEF